MKPKITPNKRQHLAWQVLLDSETNFLLFGGGAGGGKSWLGCEWLLYMCYVYPETRWFIGREELKRLRDSTLQTFFKVCSYHNIPFDDYKYNGSDHFIKFKNGSRIDMLDLKFLPSDQLYERFGSVEFTGGFIEEAGEVHFKAFDALKVRIGRCLNDKYNLTAKIFITANPKKNWLYETFYKPNKSNTLALEYKFIQSLARDNEKLPKEYLKNLDSISDAVTKERLRDGVWEYDDSDTQLFQYDALSDMFTNSHVIQGQSIISADIARLGSDKSVFGRWSGFVLEEIKTIDVMTLTSQVEILNNMKQQHSIASSYIVCDEDGVGGGVVDMLHCKGFVNGSKAISSNRKKPENYKNLKTQCAYKIAEIINSRQLYIKDKTHRDTIIQELDAYRRKKIDSDGRLEIYSKEDVKASIGRSPDFADMIIMRSFFELSVGQLIA